MNRSLLRRQLFAGLIFSALVLAFGVRTASAHGYLVRSIPQDRATIPHAPSRVQIWFSESLESRFSTLSVTDQSGKIVDLANGGVAANNPDLLEVRLQPNLPDGAYIATMRTAFRSDGHVATDTLVFWVGHQTDSTTTSGANTDVPTLEVIARALTLIGMMLAFGALLLYRAVLLPAWRNPQYRAGGLAPRIMSTLSIVIGATLGVAITGNALWIVQQSMALFNADVGRVFRESLWSVVINGTQFGDILKVRIVLLIAAASLLGVADRLRAERPALVLALWSISGVIMGGALATLSVTAHAAGSTLWPLLAIGVDWLHVLANSAWIGGLIALIAALRPALSPLDSEGRRLALLAALRRFSPLAAAAVLIMAASGVFSALLYVYTPDQLLSTNYGRTLIAKLVLVAPLLLIGLIHRITLQPGCFARFERWITLSLRGESALGVGVILIVALLTATPPPVPPNARASVAQPIFTASDMIYSLTLRPAPNAAGSNSYDILLTRGTVPLDSAKVSVQFVYPALGLRATPITLDGQGAGLYIGAGAELDRAGGWQAIFDVTPPDSTTPVRLALSWSVLDQSTQNADRLPSVLNVVSLAAVLLALAWWIIPILRSPTIGGRLPALHIDPQLALLGVAILIVTVIVMGGGALYLASAASSYRLAANPPPSFINPTLPDQNALNVGKPIYATNCASCHETGQPLTSYLTSHGDSDIYRFLQGTPSHPYADQLSAPERWSVVNYLRAHFESGLP